MDMSQSRQDGLILIRDENLYATDLMKSGNSPKTKNWKLWTTEPLFRILINYNSHSQGRFNQFKWSIQIVGMRLST